MTQIAPPCDRGVAYATPFHETRAKGRFVLAGTVLGSSLAFIDGSAVNLALPAIQDDFRGGPQAAQWIVNAYLLMLSALVLAGGAAGDRYGRRRMFVWGVGLFTVASAVCGLAPSVPVLVAARAAQGIGAALLTPASLAILGAAFDDKARARAVGIWAGASGLAGAVGPALGGWLTEAVSWRAVFLINLPLAALAIWMILAGASETRAPRSGPLDLAGVASATFGLGALTWGLTVAPERGLADPLVLAAVAVGLAASAGFVAVEWRAKDPMLPLALFRSRNFSGANALTLLLYAAFGGALFLMPFHLIRVHSYLPATAGAALLPLSAGLAILSPIAGRLSDRLGARTLLTVGPLLCAAGFAWLAATAGQAGYWTSLFPGLAVLALGMGLAVAPLTDTVLASVDRAYEGAAAGVNNAVARVAGLLAVAMAGFVLAAPGGPGPARAALLEGFRAAMLVAAVCAAAAGAAGAAAIRRRSPPRQG